MCTQLVKLFPGVRALDGVDLDLRPGTVHALLGENGAGKSTLIKVLTGVHKADGGTVLVGEGDDEPDRPVVFSGPSDAQTAGIGVVHQERNLVPAFSVAENIALQALPSRAGLVDRAGVREIARRCLAMLDLDLDLDRPVAELSVAHMQLVEIAKALATDSQVLLLDEPTASLTAEEADRLYDVVRRLREQGHVVVLVTHKLEEVFAIADVVTVLRDGRSVAGSVPLSSLTRSDVVDLMVGRAHTERELQAREVDRSTTPALELRGVSTSVGHRDVDLAVHRGEIVGLYGLVGAGRSELVRALLGLDSVTGGSVLVDGRSVTIRSVGDALRRHRIGYVTENRKEEGVFLTQTVTRNVAVTVWDRLARLGLVAERRERDLLATYQERLGIRLSGPTQLAGQLSGGNQQKISLAKWLAADCSVLVIDEPTVGIDVRTKAAFHELIVQLSEQGLAILLISSDLPEMVALADRVAVMHERRLTGEVENSHDYAAMSGRIIRLVHGEQAADAPPAA
ncbi:sugar ABC transporter ATP-binding protein [Nocardioides kribbensis]